MPRSCRRAHQRAIPFDCAFNADHAGSCSPYTLPPRPSEPTHTTASSIQDATTEHASGTIEIDWPDGTRATWFLAAEHLDTAAELIERSFKPADSIKT